MSKSFDIATWAHRSRLRQAALRAAADLKRFESMNGTGRGISAERWSREMFAEHRRLVEAAEATNASYQEALHDTQ